MSLDKSGSTVKIHFTGKTQDGKVVTTSEGQDPLEFTIGEGEVLPGIEKAVIGMSVGEKKRTKIAPEEAFGYRHEELVLEVERAHMPQDIEEHVGSLLQVQYPDGSFGLFKILYVTEKTVKLDANHPLAGESLIFDFELLDIA